MLKLLYDVTENRWYDAYGVGFPSDHPQIPYGNTERIAIQLFRKVGETNMGNSVEITPSAESGWLEYQGYSQINNIGAVLATDNNFLHRYKGTLSSAATNSSVSITCGASIDDVPASGTIRIGSGENEVALSYDSRTKSGNVFTFALTSGQTVGTFAAGTAADIPEALYAQAEMNVSESDPSEGLFVFDFMCDSQKLRNKMQYQNIAILDDCKGLELTVFTTDTEDDSVTILNRFRCPSFRITGGIADIGNGVPVSEPEENAIKAIIDAYLSGITGGSTYWEGPNA